MVADLHTLHPDRKVNRLEDSYLLWRSVCSCKLLARTQVGVCLESNFFDADFIFREFRSDYPVPQQM
jgi:hypothetical protein